MELPQETYRWLVSIKIIPNEGQIGNKTMVNIPQTIAPLFENGCKIAQILRSILKRQGLNIPVCLSRIQQKSSKDAKLSNWNLIWSSFDALRMQFDNKIKQLILLGQNTLIIQIIKQLYDRDQSQDEAIKSKIKIKGNKQKLKTQQPPLKSNSKGGTLDIKKINLQKSPDQSQSMLQLLILLLSSSLNTSVEEVLGLFTNQNKYLTHLIVNGVNEDFSGIILFYSLIVKNINKLKMLMERDKKDIEFCLLTIKPGFVSHNQQVVQITINIFTKIDNLYNWFINDVGKGSTTFMLGIKKHPQLLNQFWNLLNLIIKNQQIQFFTDFFKQSFKDTAQMIQVCQTLTKPLKDFFLLDKLVSIGIFGQWIEIAVNMLQGQLDKQLLSLRFLGEMMLNLPSTILKNEQCLNVLAKDWKQRKVINFTYLINQMIAILCKLAANRNHFASKLYQIIICIFQQISTQKLKRQYLVENLSVIIPSLPKIPIEYFIQIYSQKTLDSSDYHLIQLAIQHRSDVQALTKIGEVLLKMFNHSSVINAFVAPLIYNISKKALTNQIGQVFIIKAIRDCLHTYSILKIHKSDKDQQNSKNQTSNFTKLGTSERISQYQHESSRNRDYRESSNLVELVDKLCQLGKQLDNDQLNSQIRQQLLQSSSFIKRNNQKVSRKQIEALLPKYNISKQQQKQYENSHRSKKPNVDQSLNKKKSTINNLSEISLSPRVHPQTLKKQFSDIIQKRKKQQQQKKIQQQQKIILENKKLAQAKKQLQIQQILRGFGSGQSEIKEQGFWNKLLKDQGKQRQLYMPSLMEQIQSDIIDTLLKKYHRATRLLFLRYSSSMYTIKSANNFEDNQIRKQTLNLTQIIKFLKQFKLFSLTSQTQIQNFIRDINVKLLNKRQINQLDFVGFQCFLLQFSAVILIVPHSIQTKMNKDVKLVYKKLSHLSHSQLLQELFQYIKRIFQERKQKTQIFDEPESAYFNQSDIIKDFNKKLQSNPTLILPEGYKKVTEKVITLIPSISQNTRKNINSSYIDVLQVLDKIIHESQLKFHILQPISKKSTKTRVKPHAFVNTKTKILNDSNQKQTKNIRISSLASQRRPLPNSQKMLERKVFSFGMKIGLSYVSYKDKLLGEQVAYILDDMIKAIEKGRSTLEKQKIQNVIQKQKNLAYEQQKKQQQKKQQKRLFRKRQLNRLKKQYEQKKSKQQNENKEQRQKIKKQEEQKKIKKELSIKKYLNRNKQIIQQKKKKQLEQKQQLQQSQKVKKLQQEKSNKKKFQQFNKMQIQKLAKSSENSNQLKKLQQLKKQSQIKNQQSEHLKLKNKIHQQSKKVNDLTHKNYQQINQLFHSPQISQLFQLFEPNLKAIFDFLIKSTHLSLTQRKHNNEIIYERWNYFTIAFQLNPFIISSKNVLHIFKSITKDKQINKQYYIGLSFQQFQLALLRITIKQKTIFNKISQNIKQSCITQKQINSILQQNAQQKQKNQFQQTKQIDVKNLLVESDINKDIFDDYGQIKKVTPNTLKGLIYYLKVPKDKPGQQKRWRQIIASKNQYMEKYRKLNEKLKEQYHLESPEIKNKNKTKVVRPLQSTNQEH